MTIPMFSFIDLLIKKESALSLLAAPIAMNVFTTLNRLCWGLLLSLVFPVLGKGEIAKEGLPESVSYYEHVRPVFQAKCHGCHQPKDYYDRLVAQLARASAPRRVVTLAAAPTPEMSQSSDLVSLSY